MNTTYIGDACQGNCGGVNFKDVGLLLIFLPMLWLLLSHLYASWLRKNHPRFKTIEDKKPDDALKIRISFVKAIGEFTGFSMMTAFMIQQYGVGTGVDYRPWQFDMFTITACIAVSIYMYELVSLQWERIKTVTLAHHMATFLACGYGEFKYKGELVYTGYFSIILWLGVCYNWVIDLTLIAYRLAAKPVSQRMYRTIKYQALHVLCLRVVQLSSQISFLAYYWYDFTPLQRIMVPIVSLVYLAAEVQTPLDLWGLYKNKKQQTKKHIAEQQEQHNNPGVEIELLDRDSAREQQASEARFPATYYEGRDAFRAAASAAHCEVTELPLQAVPGDADLTIDIAVLRGSSKKVVLHVSGTHGVEGFAGSAVQTQLLREYATGVRTHASGEEAPTVVFVHALNPYGFANLRRWNENNVDLNRNMLQEDQFASLVAQSEEVNALYVQQSGIINPSGRVGWCDCFMLKALCRIACYGFASLKGAIVSGQYHEPRGLFFGGSELQQSHRLLCEWLKNKSGLLETATSVAVIDVHTGLGPKGVDTLLVDEAESEELARRTFGPAEEDGCGTIENHRSSSADGQASGGAYKNFAGSTKGYARLFTASGAKKMALTQEFGTAKGMRVFRALRAENAAYWAAPAGEARHSVAHPSVRKEKLAVRGVFFLEDDPEWKASFVRRAASVFDAAHKSVTAEYSKPSVDPL